MKRKLPDCFSDDDLELDFLNKIPQIDGEERETDAIEYRFDFTLRHIASVNLLYSKCLEYMREDVVKTFYRNCAGEIYFADILLKYLYSSFPYFSATRIRLSTMVNQVVNSVYNWIRHIDRTVFNIRCARQSVALDFAHHIKITSRGTIDYAKSAESLLNDPKFEDVDRLKIITVHCLERYVYAAVSRVTISEDAAKRIFSGTREMIDFWRERVTSGELMRSPRYTIDERVYNAVGVTNAESVKFLWAKSSGEDRKKMLIKLIRRSEADLQCYLLSQVNGEEQQNVFHVCGGVVLNNLFEDFVWSSYLLTTAFHARNVIPSRQYYEFMKRVTFCMQFDKRLCRNDIIFRQLWRYSTKRIKDLIFRHENSHIFYWFRNDINAEYMLTLFSDASAGFKQNFILSNSCTKACMEMIKNNNLNVLETVVKKTYTEEDEIHNFKQILLNDDRCKEVIAHLTNAGDKIKFDSTMKWFFRNEDEIKTFKKHFSSTPHYLNLFKDLLNRAIYENINAKKVRDEINFVVLDEKIHWFLSTIEEINEFKITILATSDSLIGAVHELIKSEQYGLVEQLLRWCLSHPTNVTEFKEKLYGKRTKSENADLAYTLLWKNDEFKSLDDFLSWCYGTNETKMAEFKESLMTGYKEARRIWGSFIIREEFDFAEQFMRWCGKKNDAEIVAYKNELIFNLDLEYVTNDVQYTLELRDGEYFGSTEADRLLKGHRLIKWLAPTVETYSKFKILLFTDPTKYSKVCNLIRIYMEENDVDGFDDGYES